MREQRRGRTITSWKTLMRRRYCTIITAVIAAEWNPYGELALNAWFARILTCVRTAWIRLWRARLDARRMPFNPLNYLWWVTDYLYMSGNGVCGAYKSPS